MAEFAFVLIFFGFDNGRTDACGSARDWGSAGAGWPDSFRNGEVMALAIALTALLNPDSSVRVEA